MYLKYLFFQENKLLSEKHEKEIAILRREVNIKSSNVQDLQQQYQTLTEQHETLKERFEGINQLSHNRMKTFNETITKKNTLVESLETDVEQWKQVAKEWKNKFEMQDSKTERAHQERMEAEEKIEKLNKVNEKFRQQLIETTNSRKFLQQRIEILRKEIESKKFEIHENNDNLQYMIKIINKKDKKNLKIINGLNENLLRYKRKMDQLNDRESDILFMIEELANYIRQYNSKGCFYNLLKCSAKIENVALNVIDEIYEKIVQGSSNELFC